MTPSVVRTGQPVGVTRDPTVLAILAAARCPAGPSPERPAAEGQGRFACLAWAVPGIVRPGDDQWPAGLLRPGVFALIRRGHIHCYGMLG